MRKLHFIFEAVARNLKGQQRKYSRLFYCTASEARTAAQDYRDSLLKDGFSGVKVSIYRVDEMTYCGAIRG